jgi:hypothetical protein
VDDGENRVAAIKVGLKAGGRNVGVAGNPAAADDLNDGEAVGLGARGLEDVECKRGAIFAAVDDIFGAGVGARVERWAWSARWCGRRRKRGRAAGESGGVACVEKARAKDRCDYGSSALTTRVRRGAVARDDGPIRGSEIEVGNFHGGDPAKLDVFERGGRGAAVTRAGRRKETSRSPRACNRSGTARARA